MGAYDDGFGVTLIATWLATLLAGVGLTHAVHYFAKFSNDIFFKKALAGVVLFLLFLELGMECAETYLDVVTYWGNPAALYVVSWPRSVSIPCISLIGFIVDQFLIHRFYAVSKNIWITLILSMCNLVSLVLGLIITQIFAGHIGKSFTPAELRKILPLSDVWSSSSAVTDVAITASLVWVLRGMKTSFKDTNQLIQHITAVSIQNGCTTSAVAIGGLVANKLAPETSICYAFYYTIGPLYLLTLLSNLTLRESAPVPVNQGWSSYVDPASRNDLQRSVPTTGRASMTTDVEASRGEDADSTVRGTSDDIEAGGNSKESVHSDLF
ncbi:hypothetical protein C8R46DRAFT_374517 [Mycena filopes]|nr:hypothetical protein C8R46DRAFT_374517 [Mycena filopes]